MLNQFTFYLNRMKLVILEKMRIDNVPPGTKFNSHLTTQNACIGNLEFIRANEV